MSDGKDDNGYYTFDCYTDDDVKQVNLQVGQVFIAHQSLIHAGGESYFSDTKKNQCVNMFQEKITHLSIHSYVKIIKSDEIHMASDEEKKESADPTTVFVKLNESTNEK